MKSDAVKLILAVATAILALSLPAVHASNVTLTNNDASGTSSFAAAGNWSNGQAPSAANTYQSAFTLRVAATAVDRLNKRFYAKLTAEARTNAALADALAQIDTESAGLPGTLGISGILQGGTDHLHILVSYDPGTYDGSATSTIEWMVTGVDTDFTHNAPADPSGNALGPFTVGSTVQLRTRVTNSNGTTTGSVRTLTLQ